MPPPRFLSRSLPSPSKWRHDGQRYDELHVDGGAASQVFLYPAAIDWTRVLEKLESPGKPEVYVIRNSRINPKPSTVKRKLIPITGSTISSLIRTQGIGDLYRIYALTERDGLEFNLAHIPDSFDAVPAEQFDPVWMRELFEVGREMAKAGYPWNQVPPGFEGLEGDSERDH